MRALSGETPETMVGATQRAGTSTSPPASICFFGGGSGVGGESVCLGGGGGLGAVHTHPSIHRSTHTDSHPPTHIDRQRDRQRQALAFSPFPNDFKRPARRCACRSETMRARSCFWFPCASYMALGVLLGGGGEWVGG